jgi:hypothetical protein
MNEKDQVRRVRPKSKDEQGYGCLHLCARGCLHWGTGLRLLRDLERCKEQVTVGLHMHGLKRFARVEMRN